MLDILLTTKSLNAISEKHWSNVSVQVPRHSCVCQHRQTIFLGSKYPVHSVFMPLSPSLEILSITSQRSSSESQRHLKLASILKRALVKRSDTFPLLGCVWIEVYCPPLSLRLLASMSRSSMSGSLMRFIRSRLARLNGPARAYLQGHYFRCSCNLQDGRICLAVYAGY